MSQGRKKGTERRQVRVFARTQFEADLPVFKSNTEALHSSWRMPMVNVLSANNLDSFLLSTSSHGHTREMRGWAFVTSAK